MRKASKVLFLVGAILSIVSAVYYLVFGIIFVVIPNTDAFADFLAEAQKNGTTLPEGGEDVVRGVFIGLGVCFLLLTVFGGINSFFGFKAFKQAKPSRALNVLNIVFGVLASVFVNLVGAIFALIADGQEERRAALKKE